MSNLARPPLSVSPSKRNIILESGNEIPALQAEKLAFPKIVENAANAFGDTADSSIPSKRLESIKEHFENLKNTFLSVKQNGSFINYLDKDIPFEEFSTEKENENGEGSMVMKKMNATKEELRTEQVALRRVEDDTMKTRATLTATTKDLFDAFRQTKRKFQETENALGTMLLKKQKLSDSSSKILEKIANSNNNSNSSSSNAETIDGCQTILNEQTETMQKLGEEEVKMQQILFLKVIK